MSKSLRCLFALYLAFTGVGSAWSDQISPQETARAQVKWKKLFQQVFTWNLKAQLKAQGASDREVAARFEKSTYYSDQDFFSIYQQVTSAPTSFEANQRREALLAQREPLFRASHLAGVGSLDLERSAAGPLVRGIAELAQTERAAKDYQSGLNYFETPLGRDVFAALQDTILVVIPGFGSHTMKDYSYSELVKMANAYYGRPLDRPRQEVPGTDQVKFEEPTTFYARNKRPLGFDVVHPMGYELGNSMGSNSDVAAQLAQWIRHLPTEYANKKLIFIGYSKGAPIAHHLVQEHEDMRNRSRAIFTIGGVVQGAVPAQSGLNLLMEALQVNNRDELLAKLKQAHEDLLAKVGPYLTGAAGWALTVAESPSVKRLLGSIGVDAASAIGGLRNFLHTQQVLEVFKGAYDMTPYARTKWSLQYLNNRSLGQKGLTIFNLSVLTNAQDFLSPGDFDEFGPMLPPQVVPQFGPQGVEWQKLSLDNIFLHGTSLGAFEEAPGGLFDTQVAWLDTKSIVLDQRPLSHSLTPKELGELQRELGRPVDAQVPRRQLIPAADLDGLNFVDLGETRGSHWDISFTQVYRPPEKLGKSYVHLFPRDAYYRSLLETYAVYVQLGKGGN